MNFWCFCGRVAQEKYNGKCKHHANKEAPLKKSASPKFRGDSKWQKQQGMFNNKGE